MGVMAIDDFVAAETLCGSKFQLKSILEANFLFSAPDGA